MIVLTLTNCPISLRGDLTKWLLEVNTGVFVGRVSARVRDNLWKRVIENVKQGQATLVYNTNNEQHMEFKIHQSENEIIDFDGLKLVLRPSSSRIKQISSRRLGFSKAAKMLMAKRRQNKIVCNIATNSLTYPQNYVILDLETSGLNAVNDEIIEIGMLKIRNNEIAESYSSLIKVKTPLKPIIVQLTGINDDLLSKDGRNLAEVLLEACDFIGDDILLGHNIAFDMGFVYQNLQKYGIEMLQNRTFDTMEMYGKILNGRKSSKKLIDVAKNYGIKVENTHRSIVDCLTIKNVYDMIRKNQEK